MVNGGGCVLLPPYITIAQEWAEEVRIVAAGDKHINSGTRGRSSARPRGVWNGGAIRCLGICWNTVSVEDDTGLIVTRPPTAIVYSVGLGSCLKWASTEDLAGPVWILAQRNRVNLVQISPPPQVCPLAANIGDDTNHVRRQLMFNVEMPLLNIWPDLFLGDRNHALWELRAERAHLGVTRGLDAIVRIENCRNNALDRVQHQRR